MNRLLLSDALIIEGETEVTAEKFFLAVQRAINQSAWLLQGTFGRSMMAAIEDGFCMLGTRAATDYWGNRIPARSAIRAGRAGTRAYVASAMGEDWAALMEAVP